MQGLSIREVPSELGRNAIGVLELRGCFVKMGTTFPDTLPVENQSAVLHQNLLSHVGLGLDVVAPQPRHLRSA